MLLLIVYLCGCKTQINNTVWVNSVVNCNQYRFLGNNEAEYINCESGDTIFCTYSLKMDTVVIDHLKSIFDNNFPANSLHLFKRYRTMNLLKGDHLYPLSIEDYENDKWVKSSFTYEKDNYYSMESKVNTERHD